MRWEGLSTGDLCRMLKNKELNGKRTPEKIVGHIATDELVLWAWQPGGRRTRVQIAHQDFVNLLKVWAAGGWRARNDGSEFMITLHVNGQPRSLDLDRTMPLLWALRDELSLTGTKFGSGRALCGACTVHVDGEAARSCSIMVGEVEGKPIVTIEGLSGDIATAVRGFRRPFRNAAIASPAS
jgi:hypothetical protein